MRRAGCPDPAAAGLGFATGRGRRARGRTGRGHPGLSAGRAGGRRGNRRPGRLGGARTARAADRRAIAGVAAGGRARGLLYGRGMINLLERLTASVGHRQAELAAVEASEGRALAFVAVNKATGAVACSVLARERMGCAHSGQARLGAYHRPAPERRMTRHLGGMDARRAGARGSLHGMTNLHARADKQASTPGAKLASICPQERRAFIAVNERATRARPAFQETP